MIRCGIGSEYDGVGENKQDDAQWYRNVSECERLASPMACTFTLTLKIPIWPPVRPAIP